MRELNEVDKRLIHLLSGDLGDSPAPYADLAAQMGLEESRILELIQEYQSEKIIRRFGATLWHQRSGFAANAMVVFDIPTERAEAIGRELATRPYVSHCYLRRTAPGWPFNLYVMIHAENREKILEMTRELADLAGAGNWRMLESLKELKKASRRYFSENQADVAEA